MPLFNPYHKFYFSDGFTIVPPPTDPYLPSSGRLLTEFIPDFNANITIPVVPVGMANGVTGDIGNGRNRALECFDFNARGASLGCDSKGPDCNWQFTGTVWNASIATEQEVVTQHISTSACPSLINCTLVPILLDANFRNLSSLRINVTVAGEPKIWWMDDLLLAWTDDSCDAGLCRQAHR
jgi:hypothetical protein